MRSPILIRGFSLLEFMIAISLGALLVATVSMTYLSNRNVHTVQDNLARLQENARYLSFIVAREVRMAGYTGCANRRNIAVNNKASTNTDTLDFDNALKGYEGGGGGFTPTLPTNLTGLPVADSDVLEMRAGSSLSVQLRDNMNLTNNPILVYDRLGIEAGDPMLITNCRVGDIFIAGANSSSAFAITHTKSNNESNHVSVSYTTDAQVMHFRYYAYYIADTGRVNASGQPVRALVRQHFNGDTVELAEGVEEMRIHYGVDTNANNNINRFMTAGEVEASNNWGNVINVQIRLLMATLEEVNEKPQTYRFNDQVITPGDRKLRREWPLSITLRNRGLPS